MLCDDEDNDLEVDEGDDKPGSNGNRVRFCDIRASVSATIMDTRCVRRKQIPWRWRVLVRALPKLCCSHCLLS